MSWSIDGTSVSEGEYRRLLATLKDTGEGWYCKKTADGGRTGHEARSANGEVYVVESVTDSSGSRHTITSKNRKN